MVELDADDFGRDHLADAHVGRLQGLFEQGGKGLAAAGGGSLGLGHCVSWDPARSDGACRAMCATEVAGLRFQITPRPGPVGP